MEVVLKIKYGKLGYPNDIVSVADGFAINYLIRNGIAVPATKSEIKKAEENQRQSRLKTEALKNKALEISKQLETNGLKISVNVDKNDKLFGNISEKTIENEIFEKYQYKIDEVIINKPINKLGSFEIKVKLFKDVITSVKLSIEKK